MRKRNPIDEVTAEIFRRGGKEPPNGKNNHSAPPPGSGPAEKPKAAPRGLSTVCTATIKPTPVYWLVPGYIPRGKLVLLAGDGGHGKSTFTLTLASCISRGVPFLGLDYPAPPPGDVLLISCEDGLADTIVPRLLAAGADRQRVFHVTGVRGKDGKSESFNLSHFEAIQEHLEDHPNIRLIIVDPAGAYVGKAKVDDHKDSELRSLLGPLSDLAGAKGVTIVLVKHLNRGTKVKAVDRVSGSAGYVNTVRAAFIICHDLEDEERKLFLPLKKNLPGKTPPGRAFRLCQLGQDDREAIAGQFDNLSAADQAQLAEQLVEIVWEGDAKTNADDALSPPSGTGTNKVGKAAEWLETFLEKLAYPSEEIFEAGKKAGFTKDNLYTAKRNLPEIKAACKGYQGAWHWGTGNPDNWTIRPQYGTASHDSKDSHVSKDSKDSKV